MTQLKAFIVEDSPVIRENLVRFDRVPLIVRLPEMPALEADTRTHAVAIALREAIID